MIINLRNQNRLASKVHIADKSWSRTRGLLGQKVLTDDSALVLYPCNQIHTYFMRFTIDCLFVALDSSDRFEVVYCIHNLKPWKMIRKVNGANAVIELPEGMLAKTDTNINDYIQIKGLKRKVDVE
ncbi:DUF192 domain-containing protein [Geomicrobium sp. JSM 1781026]|uniref:DUF192 domain-containing protein n=1 Tax=Geomicrobium sp. JSM 1781026 TaxID=3344580 RepID=UPI0035C23146